AAASTTTRIVSTYAASSLRITRRHRRAQRLPVRPVDHALRVGPDAGLRRIEGLDESARGAHNQPHARQFGLRPFGTPFPLVQLRHVAVVPLGRRAVGALAQFVELIFEGRRPRPHPLQLVIERVEGLHEVLDGLLPVVQLLSEPLILLDAALPVAVERWSVTHYTPSPRSSRSCCTASPICSRSAFH